MRILLTGGAGFIGSHLCDLLINKGHNVICIDNLITGKIENIQHLLSNPNFEFIEYDVTKYIDVKGKIDYVIHFASPASPVDYLKYPIKTLKVGSLGTHNALGVAKEHKAKFLLASTSEVYGDPLVNPQPETYWGNVNPIGPRGVYDEAKRFAEAITLAYHRAHGIDTKIVRIFNSILADQPVIVFNDEELHLEEIERYANRHKFNIGANAKRIIVPCFNPETLKVELKEANALIKHTYRGDAYELNLAYGRKVKITGDHSVFKRSKDDRPVAEFARNLKAGDYIAIPARLPVVEKDLRTINIGEALIKESSDNNLWQYAAYSPALKEKINEYKAEIYKILSGSKRYNARRFSNGIFCAFNNFRRNSFLPLYIINRLGLSLLENATIRIFSAGAHIYIPNKIEISNDILWLLGFYLAEGSAYQKIGKGYFITFASDDCYLEKAASILRKEFNVHVVYSKHTKGRSPAIFIHSKLLYFIFNSMFNVIKSQNRPIEIPMWILQLPLSRLKYVLEGFREGDGTHSGKKVGNELCFDTTSDKMALQLSMILLRFGIVASVGEYTTTFRKKYGNKKFPFYRVVVCELSTFNILEWDKGVKQKLLASKKGDVVWAWIKNIRKCKPTPYVYDFCVPEAENFIAGNGVFCHNTYGPKMREHDGRAIPNFIDQALKNKPLTVYGNGTQTRSFCYITDMIDGIYRLMNSDLNEPVNIGNPDEKTLLELAEMIIRLSGSNSKIVYKPLPIDDPRVRRPDIALAKTRLDWEPKVSLEEGLKETIAWFEKTPNKA